MGNWRGESYRTDLYTGASASAITSNVEWVGDSREMTVFLRGSPSTTTIQGSNATGGHEAEGGPVTIPETSWADLQTVTSPGPDLVNIEPGFRWIRALRSETTEAVLNWQRD